jgi:hypothetical protein
VAVGDMIAIEEIDAPGEWHHDREAGRLFHLTGDDSSTFERKVCLNPINRWVFSKRMRDNFFPCMVGGLLPAPIAITITPELTPTILSPFLSATNAEIVKTTLDVKSSLVAMKLL